MSAKLKEARINAGYSIEDVSLKLNIRKQYLIDLEEENFENIPGRIYVDGYSKLYSEFLGIERPVIETNDEKNSIKAKYRFKKGVRKRFSQKHFTLVSIFLLIALFTAYNYIKTKNDPQLSNYNSNVDFSRNSSDNSIKPENSLAINNIENATKNFYKILNNENNNTGSLTSN